MFSGIVGNIRGFAQSLIKGAVGIGLGAIETYDTLAKKGIKYARDLFALDYESYNVQPFLMEQISLLDKDQLIPGGYHAEAKRKYSTKFRYEVKCTYEDIWGNIDERYWTVVSDTRLTQNQITEGADAFPAEYAPSDFPVHGEIELTGSWVRM